MANFTNQIQYNTPGTFYGGYETTNGAQDQQYTPQWLIDLAQKQGQTLSRSPGIFGGNVGWKLGDYVYSGTSREGANGGMELGNQFYRYQDTPLLRQAIASENGSILNGSPYEMVDGSGNVVGSGNWENISAGNDALLADAIVTALVGGVFGGVATGALSSGAAGGAAASSGGAGAGAAGAEGAATFGAGGLGTGSATGGVGYGLGGSTYGGAAIGSGIDFGAAAAGGAAGAEGAGTFGGGWGSATGGQSYGLGSSLGEAAPYTYGGESMYTTPYNWSAGTSAMGAGAGGGSGGGSGSGSSGSSLQNILNGNGSMSDWAGLATTALGAYGGSQGQNQSATSSRAMDPRMDSLFYGQLAPMTQGLLAGTTPQATMAGSQLLSKGSGLLGQTAPTTATNPYLSGIADDMQRRTQDLLGRNNLAIQGNAVATGGLGGSRQGVAQGLAAGQAADSLQGQVAGLYGNAYQQDQNRLRQDWTLGSGMLSQGVALPFSPAQSASQIYSPFTGFGTTTNSAQSGGGTMGALGGALGAAQWYQNMYGNNNSGAPPNPYYSGSGSSGRIW